jgi:hypothetical protein
MINNINLIKTLLKFKSEDEFYHLQVLKRKKENPELGSNSYTVKTYYIGSIEYLDSKMPEIINLCEFHNARAYINLNRRSYEQLSLQVLKKIIDQMSNQDFKSIKSAYDSVCGSFIKEKHKRWIIDLDGVDQFNVSPLMLAHIDHHCEPITKALDPSKLIAIVPTKNGCHLITSPFNAKTFSDKYPDIDIQKNNPSVLYCP